jgi:ABC-2 type transport system ATP-binding protein
MISLNSVTKQFKTKTAVSNVSFQAKEGEIIGFLGPNGAGKTTTMRLILGYLTPTSGEVQVNNRDPQHNRIQTLKSIGYLPENNPLYTEMKVKEYLQFIAEVKQTKNVDQIEIVAKDVGLDDVMNTKIEELSRGYKQRVGLATALLGTPTILILDEPTSGLDPIEQDKIKELIKKTAKKKTVIFSTHILSEVEDIATRLVIINKGVVIYDGKKPEGKGGVEKLFKDLMSGKKETKNEKIKKKNVETKPVKKKVVGKKKG